MPGADKTDWCFLMKMNTVNLCILSLTRFCT